MDDEIWLPSSEFDNYEISNTGLIRNKKTGHLMKITVNSKGQGIVNLRERGQQYTRKVKRLVAGAFLEEDICDMDVFTKDDELSVTPDNLYLKPRVKNRRVQVVETGEIFASISDCSRALGISKSTVSKCCNYDFYKNRLGYNLKFID